MQIDWMQTSKHAPAENTEVAILVPITDNNGDYRQIPTIATYSKEGRYESTTNYYKNVSYYIPFSRDVDISPPDGFAKFTKLAGPSAKPETGDDPDIVYVVRMEHENRVTFATADYKNDKWYNFAGGLYHVTHAAPLPETPPMPEEYL
ncbi:MAG: hypothetical protein LBC63_00810 [Holophagales bacterium]|jgi:hypothetical protein|nr:hypothetical protein [Holophagales bacterium]